MKPYLFTLIIFLFLTVCLCSVIITGDPLAWIDHIPCLLHTGTFGLCLLSGVLVCKCDELEPGMICDPCNELYQHSEYAQDAWHLVIWEPDGIVSKDKFVGCDCMTGELITPQDIRLSRPTFVWSTWEDWRIWRDKGKHHLYEFQSTYPIT